MVINQIITLVLVGWNIQFTTKPDTPLQVKDTLSVKNWEYFNKAIHENSTDSVNTRIYLEAWLKKAKAKSNNHQLAQAYRILSYKAPKEHRLQYADSMLMTATKTSDNLLIGNAFLTKGIVYYSRRELRKALDNYIMADKYVSLTKDYDATHMVKYTLALTKFQIGFYDEAIALFNECLTYYSNENDRAYLNTLHALALCHIKTENYGKASKLNALGIQECRELADTTMIPYFRNAVGINEVSKGNPAIGLNLLLKSLPYIKNKNDFPNEAITSYHIGKALWQLNQKEKAIPYLRNVDKIFQDKKFIQRDIRETYEWLIEYYQNKKKYDEVLKYVNILLEVDRELNKDQQYLVPKIIKEYDTAKLLEVKAQTERVLQTKNAAKSIIIAALIIIALLTGLKYYSSKKKFKKRFNDLMKEKKQSTKTPKITMKEALQDISPEVIETVIHNMEKFENDKTYLQKELTQVKLAEILETNSRYILKIVLHAKGKTTIDYICDLKIDYIVHLLKTDSRIRNFTLKGLGEEAGFGSTQRFTRAFKSRTGIMPAPFISELKKSLKKQKL